MAYIIMGRDECGDEFRADDCGYKSEKSAYKFLPEAKERYPEASNLHVELLKDKDYFMNERIYGDWWDKYDD